MDSLIGKLCSSLREMGREMKAEGDLRNGSEQKVCIMKCAVRHGSAASAWLGQH